MLTSSGVMSVAASAGIVGRVLMAKLPDVSIQAAESWAVVVVR